MDIAALNTKKIEIVQTIINEVADESILDKIKNLLRSNSKLPAQMTIEELKQDIDQSEQDFKDGKGIPHETMIKNYLG